MFSLLRIASRHQGLNTRLAWLSAAAYAFFAFSQHFQVIRHSHATGDGHYHVHPEMQAHDLTLERQILGVWGEAKIREESLATLAQPPAHAPAVAAFSDPGGAGSWVLPLDKTHGHYVEAANILALFLAFTAAWASLGLVPRLSRLRLALPTLALASATARGPPSAH